MCEISVIVPVYNVEDYLKKCIQSITKQSFQDFEVILVDDGSTDGSGALADSLAQYDRRIKVFHKQNGGLSDARNFGSAKASGRYITFIDSDDWIETNYLEYLYEAATKYKAQIATCYYNVIDGNKVTPWKRIDSHFILMSGKDALLSLLYGERINVSAHGKLYDAELIHGNNKFPYGKHYEDVDTTWRYIFNSDLIAVGQLPLYNYVMRNNSIVHQVNDSIFDRSELAANAYRDLSSLDDRDITAAAERYYTFHCLSVLRSADYDNPGHLDRALELKKCVESLSPSVLANPRTPYRDRAAITLLHFGFRFYKLAWSAYSFVHNHF